MSGRHPIDVMISSTSKDLPDHRKEAADAVARALMSTWAMEQLTAGVHDALDVSLKLVDQSEIYVGIFGMRYGFIPDDPIRNPKRLSITELEYRRARERGIPILIYLMSPDHPVPVRKAGEIDPFSEQTDEGREKLAKLKKELEDRHVVGYFKNPQELRALIVQSLHDPDVIRNALAFSDAAAKPEAKEGDSGIPAAPDLYSVPAYTLTNMFIGRAAELAMLTDWSKSNDPIMVIEAIGGMGKSALTWEWVQRLTSGKHNFEGIVWYSFYEGGAQMQDFLRHTVAYITGQDPDKLKGESHDDLAMELLTQLNRGRWLLVLDGVERLLVAYHRLDAAQIRDEEVKRDLRDCISRKDNRLLQKMTTVTKSKLLISTRLMPRALEEAGDPIKGVRRRPLRGLLPADALDMMKDRGVHWDEQPVLDHFMSQIGYHGLLLKVVAGRIKTHRRARGHFDTWYEIDGKNLNLYELTDEHRRTHVLAYAFDGLDSDKRLLLSQLAAFSDAVDYDTLSVFNPYVDTDNNKDDYLKSDAYRHGVAKFDSALTELEDRGLIQWDREADSYDLHPVVRGYSFNRLENRKDTFERIHDYFTQKPHDPYDEAKSLTDLRNSLAVYRSLIGAGRIADAASFLRIDFYHALFYNLNAYSAIIEMVTPLFPDHDWNRDPAISYEFSKGYVMNALAESLAELGESATALSLYERTIPFYLSSHNYEWIIIEILNYSERLFELNRLARSMYALRLARVFADLARETILGTVDAFLMDMNIRCGTWEAAKADEANFHKHVPTFRGHYRQGTIERHRGRLEFYQGQESRSIILKGLMLATADHALTEKMRLYALLAAIELADGKLQAADMALDQALAIARRSGTYSQAPYTALLAEIRVAQGDITSAKDLIDEVFTMTMIEFDKAAIYNSAAVVYQAAGDIERAGDMVKQAYRYAWADGEPYSQWYELKRARAMLAKLGLPEPELLPFNSWLVEPIPYEGEIREIIDKIMNRRKPEAWFEDDAPEEDE